MALQTSDRKMPSVELGLLLVLGVLWGAPYALTKISLATIPPITLTAARVSIAAVTLWIVTLAFHRSVPLGWKLAPRLLIQGGLACVVPYTLIAFGQKSVDSAFAVILNSGTPVFVCLITLAWTRHESVNYRQLFGVVVGLGGVVVIVGTSGLAGIGRETAGQAAILLATLSSAISIIHGRRFIDLPPEAVAAGTLTAAAVILIPLCFLVEAPWQIKPSAASLGALAVNAVVATGLGFAIYFRLINTIGSIRTSTASYLKPAVGVLIGCTLLSESLTWTLAIGLAVVLFGIAATTAKAKSTIGPHDKTLAAGLPQQTAAQSS